MWRNKMGGGELWNSEKPLTHFIVTSLPLTFHLSRNFQEWSGYLPGFVGQIVYSVWFCGCWATTGSIISLNFSKLTVKFSIAQWLAHWPHNKIYLGSNPTSFFLLLFPTFVHWRLFIIFLLDLALLIFNIDKCMMIHFKDMCLLATHIPYTLFTQST